MGVVSVAKSTPFSTATSLMFQSYLPETLWDADKQAEVDPFYLATAAGIAYRVVGWRCTLTTDATVVNRSVVVEMWNGLNAIDVHLSGYTHAASTAIIYSFNPHLKGAGFLYLGWHINAWDPETIIDTDIYVRVRATGMQAGDQFSDIHMRIERFLLE